MYFNFCHFSSLTRINQRCAADEFVYLTLAESKKCKKEEGKYYYFVKCHNYSGVAAV